MFAMRMLTLGIVAFTLSLESPAAIAALYTEGHADLSVRLTGTELELGANLLGALVDGNVVSGFHSLADITLFVPSSTLEPRTENVAGLLNFDPIGVPAGADIYRLPSSGTEALILQAPFFGFGTYLLSVNDFIGPVTFQLTGFESSSGGEFSVYQDSFPGPTFSMATADGITAQDKLVLPVGAHDHFNFVFTKEGLYQIDFSVSAVHKSLGALSTTGRLGVGVTTTVPEASTLILAGIGFLVGAWSLRNRIASR